MRVQGRRQRHNVSLGNIYVTPVRSWVQAQTNMATDPPRGLTLVRHHRARDTKDRLPRERCGYQERE